jgi:23S rRNA (uracil1939-C5)-methyltransferase
LSAKRDDPVAPLNPAAVETVIDHLGSAGDGVARRDGAGPLHVARALPGERVRVRIDAEGPRGGRATLVEVLVPSADRVMPPCPHFDALCGGCALQQLNDSAYAAWKRSLVVAALERAGFADPAVAPLQRTPPFARRRFDLAAQRVPGGLRLGLHQAHGSDIVDMSACPVMHAALFALVAPLRKTLSSLAALRSAGSVAANLLQGGADLLLRTDGPLAPTDRAKLASFAAEHGVPRISWALGAGPSEPAALTATPYALFAGRHVEPPPGAFLQASAEGEAAIVAAVLASLPKRLTGKSRAIELFAGCGTISFSVASHLRVLAFEGDAGAAACVRRAQAGSHVEMTTRDLVRQPLSAKELGAAVVVILDPPYAGASLQMPPIAAAGVPRVIYVSCNPGALARDAGVLRQAGYRLIGATPIDQFLWSAQVECVAVFDRKGKVGGG